MEVKFIEFREGDEWVRGNVNQGDYTFTAKLHDQGSKHGINKGRVSKLEIFYGKRRKGFGNVFVSYDRGWGEKPKKDIEKEVYNNVLNFLEDAPKNRF